MGKIHKTQSGKRHMGRYIRERGERETEIARELERETLSGDEKRR
jgi:hypothetical protein